MTASSSDGALLDRMHSLMHELKHHMHEAMSAEGNGLGMMEARCLHYFAHHRDATQSDLVQHSGRDKAQIARIVKSLIERGLLLGRPNPADRRSQVMSVSANGEALQRKMAGHRAAFEERLMKGFSRAERDTLNALMERLQVNARRD